MDIFTENDPAFVIRRRAKNYIKYEEHGYWDATALPFPAIIFQCLNELVEVRLNRVIDQLSRDPIGIEFIVSNMLKSSSLNGSSPVNK